MKILSLAPVIIMLLSVVSLSVTAETGVNTNALEKNGVQYKGTVKIGSVMCEAGAFAGVGVPYSQYYKLFVKYINEVMGGVVKGADGVGYYLDHVAYDDQSEGPLAKTYVEKLVEDDEVFSGRQPGHLIIAATQDTSRIRRAFRLLAPAPPFSTTRLPKATALHLPRAAHLHHRRSHHAAARDELAPDCGLRRGAPRSA